MDGPSRGDLDDAGADSGRRRRPRVLGQEQADPGADVDASADATQKVQVAAAPAAQ